ncbi:MAG TPA: pyridoxamine 5'-phosphate oxidase family protein, partial [Azonexus sp.]|nr:pyridoxamine 5'-phosphate oxidase family protein [Azonexus sp.]
MSRHFAHIAFTPGVRAEQRRYNGQEAPMTAAGETPELEDGERAFIAARNSFYLATVNADGWPHVQHRGGATGFLKVVGPSLMAFADYGGNRQFVSVGNLMEHPKAATRISMTRSATGSPGDETACSKAGSASAAGHTSMVPRIFRRRRF